MRNKINKPLVSIIVNCHNGERYLSESLKSIQSQTYNNYEVIFLTIVLQIIAQKYFVNLMISFLYLFFQKTNFSSKMHEFLLLIYAMER